MALLPNEIYDDIAKFLKISSYKDIVFTSRRMRWIMDPFMRRQKIRFPIAKTDIRIIRRKPLEAVFQIRRYPPYSVRKDLAEKNNLSAKQVLVWFKNRRVKARKMRRLENKNVRNGRRAALFEYDMWSVYQRTLDGEGRTNNHAEAAHRRLQTELAHDHPTLYALIDGLKKAQAARDVEYEEFVRGDAPPQKRQKFQAADARILAILEKYDDRTLIEILRGISQSYGMV
ncbi:homeobox domain-containing protein [Ditylenchus destructor]|nr:homeobox domain-containing protein [Ditylenchus destructor]